MNYRLLLFFSLSFLVIINLSCNKNVSVKVIEEHDPIVKIIEERDSMVVFPTDSLKNKPSNKR